MNMNTTILREISFQITEGNPLWGMLLANEYLDQSHPLRGAMVSRFVRSLGETAVKRGTLAYALIKGNRKNELSAEHAALVGSRTVRKTKTVVISPISTRHRFAQKRLAVRQRPSRKVVSVTTFLQPQKSRD